MWSIRRQCAHDDGPIIEPQSEREAAMWHRPPEDFARSSDFVLVDSSGICRKRSDAIIIALNPRCKLAFGECQPRPRCRILSYDCYLSDREYIHPCGGGRRQEVQVAIHHSHNDVIGHGILAGNHFAKCRDSPSSQSLMREDDGQSSL